MAPLAGEVDAASVTEVQSLGGIRAVPELGFSESQPLKEGLRRSRIRGDVSTLR